MIFFGGGSDAISVRNCIRRIGVGVPATTDRDADGPREGSAGHGEPQHQPVADGFDPLMAIQADYAARSDGDAVVDGGGR